MELISKEQAIDAAKDWYEGLICGSINGLIKRLNALPTIQPKRGRWIDKGVCTYIDNCRHLYKCDQCGGGWLDTPDFCPNCGADMRGEQDGRTDQQTGSD